jgi:hypothetical protein
VIGRSFFIFNGCPWAFSKAQTDPWSDKKEVKLMENMWLVAAEWLGLALVSGLLAGWTGVSISLMEIAEVY